MNREKIRAAYAAAHPSESKQKVAANVGQIYRFAHCMAQGSTVVMYDPAERLYHIGVIDGPCKPTSESESLTYTRTVKWGKTALRDALSPASKNSLGGIQTIFAVSDEVMSDLEAAGSKPACNDSPADADDNATNDEETLAATYDNGIELIKDRVNQLDWEDMERLVAGMLKAMGYCARVMPKGPDGGRDVVASPDALRLESPRIVAEVKHRKGAMGAPTVRSFTAGCAQATAAYTYPRAVLLRKPATRPTVPTSPCACSTWTPSCATTSTSTTRPMTTLAPSSHSPASGGQRKERRSQSSKLLSISPRK